MIFDIPIVAADLWATKPWRRNLDVTRLNTTNSANDAVDVRITEPH
jgi:hypothetical protein